MTNSKFGSKTVFVTVGTTRFDDLVRQVVADEMCQKFRQSGFKRMIVQTGSSPIPIQTQVCGLDVHCYDYKASIHDDIKNADLVISHAGAGTVLETLSLGKPLITVVNEKLMNNHQMELAQQMHKDGHSLYCTCSTLQETLTKMDVDALCRFTPGDPMKFGNFMDKLVGFS